MTVDEALAYLDAGKPTGPDATEELVEVAEVLAAEVRRLRAAEAALDDAFVAYKKGMME